MKAKRALGRRFVREYVRVKPHILDKVDQFYNAWMRGHPTIGVHIRGTDFAYAEPTAPESYFNAIDQYLAVANIDGHRIFLATDQTQFVNLFHRRYGKRILTYQCLRSNRDLPAFKFDWESPYRRGEDVLIDVILLSRTDFLFKGAAAGGEYALYFNPILECHDFALQSSFDPRDFADLVSAYKKLGIHRPLFSIRDNPLFRRMLRRLVSM
jgi:hypothetical protein